MKILRISFIALKCANLRRPGLLSKRLLLALSAVLATPGVWADHQVFATSNLSLTQLATGLDRPISIANAGDGSNRLFILQQDGAIRIYKPGTGLVATPFLDIAPLVDSTQNEQGLLGLAFHPNYPATNAFFVNYTYDPPGNNLDRTRIAQYSVSGNGDIALTAETVIMEIQEDLWNHNGGDMHFGPDGYLYIASGDGGGSNDQFANGQDVDNLKGKLLRIDVDGGGSAPEDCDETPVQNYTIPPGNAFPGDGDGCDEILHFGLRNPWRFSFDAQTGELYIGDVGQNQFEEIDIAQPGDSGTNFGWSCREGANNFPASGISCISATTDPILEYTHSGGNCSVTGGYLVRGGGTALRGHYVYGDWCTGNIWVATRDGSSWSTEEWTNINLATSNLASFGQDEECELYLVRRTGVLYRFDDSEQIAGSGFEAMNCQ